MVTVRVPASTANLGTGFDCLGMALKLYLEVSMEESSRMEIQIQPEDALPAIADNLVYQGARRLYLHVGLPEPVLRIRIDNRIPMGKGLGSSAAAWLAGLSAANRLLGDPVTQEELLGIALELEGHPDNLVPAMAGGMTVAMPENGAVYYQKIEVEAKLKAVVAVPDFVLATQDSRAVIPKAFPLNAMVANLQRSSFLVAAFLKRDYAKLKLAMSDACFEPLRRPLIPGFDEVASAAYSAGALSAVISGAGPSIAAWTLDHPLEIAAAMQQAWQKLGVKAEVFILEADNAGIQYI